MGARVGFADKHSSSEDKGAAVFIPGGAKSDESGRYGIYARSCCGTNDPTTAYRRSRQLSDGELGHIGLRREKNANYPHALPLVVAIEPLGRRRAEAARNVSEVLIGDPSAICRMSREGKISQDYSGQGVRVRHVLLRLAQGEEYDLEVVCAPKQSRSPDAFRCPRRWRYNSRSRRQTPPS